MDYLAKKAAKLMQNIKNLIWKCPLYGTVEYSLLYFHFGDGCNIAEYFSKAVEMQQVVVLVSRKKSYDVIFIFEVGESFKNQLGMGDKFSCNFLQPALQIVLSPRS